MAATEEGGVWGQAAAIGTPDGTTTVELAGVSCTAVGSCVAVGHWEGPAGVEGPIAVAETDGSWGQPVAIEPPAGATRAYFHGLSCTAVGSCVAVGEWNDAGGEEGAIAATESAGTWARAVAVAPPAGATKGDTLFGVDCPASGACVAVGGWWNGSSLRSLPMAARETGGVWGQGVPVDPPAGATEGGMLTGVDCPASGSCTAVGKWWKSATEYLPMAVGGSGASWDQAAAVDLPAGMTRGSLSGISCPAGSCTAVGASTQGSEERPIAAGETDGAWGQGVAIEPPAGAKIVESKSVSCPAAGSCVAVGSWFDPGGARLPVAFSEEVGGGGQGPGGGSSSGQTTGDTGSTPASGSTPSGGTSPCAISVEGTTIPVSHAYAAQVSLVDSGGAACDGKVSLTVPITAKGKKAKKAKSKKSEGRTIGTASLELAPGRPAIVPIKLNGAGKKALAKAHGALEASLAVKAGNAQQIVEPVRLRQASRKKARS